MPRKLDQTETQAVYKERLKQVRIHRGWTQKELAAEMGKIGHPIDRVAIAKIESGSRRMQVDELIPFALALGVPPAALFLPREAQFVQLTREIRVSAEAAGLWASGEAPLDPSDAPLYYLESPTVFAEIRTRIEARIGTRGHVWRDADREEEKS